MCVVKPYDVWLVVCEKSSLAPIATRAKEQDCEVKYTKISYGFAHACSDVVNVSVQKKIALLGLTPPASKEVCNLPSFVKR
jgi:hypothetical protein